MTEREYPLVISVVIPAHNRPEFLMEAVESVCAQRYPHWELVIVDDGSTPPLDRAPYERIAGRRLKFVRHDIALGISHAKNAAVDASSSEIIVLLDDDDLLAQDALDIIVSAYNEFPALDCLFLKVKRIGAISEAAAARGEKSLRRILDCTVAKNFSSFQLLGENLFDALLEGVPIDFQRPAFRRGAWNIVGPFGTDGIFSESAWSVRVAETCSVGITRTTVSMWRIHGANFGWDNRLEYQQNQLRKARNQVDTSRELLQRLSERERKLAARRNQVRSRASAACLNLAWRLRSIDRREGLRQIVRSFVLAPHPRQIRMALTYLIPEALLRWAGASQR